jgi:hypothetical protein
MTSANQLPTRCLVTSTEPGGIDKIAAALAIAENSPVRFQHVTRCCLRTRS